MRAQYDVDPVQRVCKLLELPLGLSEGSVITRHKCLQLIYLPFSCYPPFLQISPYFSASKSTIEAARVNTTNFFEENTWKTFGVKFSEVSLIDLVQSKNAKESLGKARKLLNRGKKYDALDKIALAFNQLLDEYEARMRRKYGYSLFFFVSQKQKILNCSKPTAYQWLNRLKQAGLIIRELCGLCQ